MLAENKQVRSEKPYKQPKLRRISIAMSAIHGLDKTDLFAFDSACWLDTIFAYEVDE